MAKIVPMELIASMSGKVCTHGDMYFTTNKQTGKVTTGKLCNPSTAPATEAQKAVREAFTKKSKLASVWLAANKPSKSNAKGTELYQSVLAEYKGQHKIGNIFAFVSANMNDDGTIKVGHGNGTSVTPDGGGNTGSDNSGEDF